jgi:hypothetical protein
MSLPPETNDEVTLGIKMKDYAAYSINELL